MSDKTQPVLRESATFDRLTIQEIQCAAETGIYDIRGGGTKRKVPHFDDLLLLGDAQAQANLASVRQNYFGLRASESRLLAEQAGRGTIEFHADLRAAADEPTVKQHMAVQLELFNARRSALRSELQAGEEGIAALQAQIAGFVDMARNRQAQSRLMAEARILSGLHAITSSLALARRVNDARALPMTSRASRWRCRCPNWGSRSASGKWS